jgi:hypothetical protein
MSTHVYPVDSSITDRIASGVAAAGLPVGLILSDAIGVSLTFTPDLTPAQVATLDLVVQAADANLPTSVYDSVRPHVQTIRDLRQLGRNAFMALTAAERDRLLYDAQAATTTILLALLRE